MNKVIFADEVTVETIVSITAVARGNVKVLDGTVPPNGTGRPLNPCTNPTDERIPICGDLVDINEVSA